MKGSKNMSYDAINLTTPDIKWLGVRPSDLDKYNIPQQCRLEMSEHDLKTGKELLQEDFVKANPAYTFGEVGKALGAAWGKLSDAQKAKYKASTSGKRQKAQGSNPEPESARTCEVCRKVLKTIAGKEMHKRDVHRA